MTDRGRHRMPKSHAAGSQREKAKINQRRTTVRNDPEVQRALNMYQLGLPRVPLAGRSGELLGRGTGSSLEFQEYREYQPGDDIRHLDWAAYGRSDRVDDSPVSRGDQPVHRDSARRQQVDGIGRVGETVGGPSIDRDVRIDVGTFGRPAFDSSTQRRTTVAEVGADRIGFTRRVSFDGVLTLVELCEQRRIPAGRQSIRIVISDFLFPHDAGSLIRQLAAGCSTLWVIQLLTAWEAAPTPVGSRRLIDLETAQQTELRIEQATIAAYLERLKRLQQELETNCRRVHAPFVSLVADRGLAQLCRGELSQVGMLRSD